VTLTDLAPPGVLDPSFSSEEAEATPWAVVRGQLSEAKVYWISTVRPDGRPHVTPIAGIWLDGTMYFVTGALERKAKNLESNRRSVITTGSNVLEGLDVVVEGTAVLERDTAKLRDLATAYRSKYGDLFDFQVRDGALRAGKSPDEALVFSIRATKVLAFAKGFTFSQTRFHF
jgi:general stress protein 26